MINQMIIHAWTHLIICEFTGLQYLVVFCTWYSWYIFLSCTNLNKIAFRCPRYPNLASTCRLVYDPTNPCCQKPECQTPAPTPGIGQSPSPGPNPTPTTQFCVYQGVPLRQGQTFNQGCDKVCKCEDAMTGKITCDDR